MTTITHYTSSEGIDWSGVIAVMQQLRPQLAAADIEQQIKTQFSLGYQLLVATNDEKVIGLAGFIVGCKLAWGKHLYIDDLVVAEQFRGQHTGQALLNHCREIAQAAGCQSLHLDSGTQRHGAHAFYLHEKMHISSFHFATSL
ncbi:GNAT family N-acetyltransferase [Alteromonas lipolytica]|uniref:N-acetyltransferase domain-containing protein n=1 Tax=Alteromonas lipolytica TaxID=1856405 RepID=A0A1E8FGL0_9ALTE|nr:GNAT family N-acetyltransferase [Alteromonas lipolytica]OFI35071.1 hypothetical protein BFC17_16095 [Alteromonas lipolytica]GGF56395.1 N-acetyltransferase GCN5 [Alteromonas lipolytica]